VGNERGQRSVEKKEQRRETFVKREGNDECRIFEKRNDAALK